MQKRLSIVLVSAVTTFLIMANDQPPANSINIVRHPSPELLTQHGVFDWQTWEKEPSQFVWQFAETEKAYILEGKVDIRPEGSNQVYTLQKGDFVTFEQGLRTHWHVKEPIKKHVVHERDLLGRAYWKVAFKVQEVPRYIKKLVA